MECNSHSFDIMTTINSIVYPYYKIIIPIVTIALIFAAQTDHYS